MDYVTTERRDNPYNKLRTVFVNFCMVARGPLCIRGGWKGTPPNTVVRKGFPRVIIDSRVVNEGLVQNPTYTKRPQLKIRRMSQKE